MWWKEALNEIEKQTSNLENNLLLAHDSLEEGKKQSDENYFKQNCVSGVEVMLITFSSNIATEVYLNIFF